MRGLKQATAWGLSLLAFVAVTRPQVATAASNTVPISNRPPAVKKTPPPPRNKSAPLSFPKSWTKDGEQPDGAFGFQAAGAGDVNGDGFDDVIVSAPKFDGGRGRVFVYRGSASGLGDRPEWTLALQNNGNVDRWSAVGAGDVNGDGFADVLICSAWPHPTEPRHESRVQLFYGSTNGLRGTPGWTRTESDLGVTFLVTAVGIGDVNGDGFSDLAMSGTDSSAGVNQVYVFVFHGGARGPAAQPDWKVVNEQNNSDFGQFRGQWPGFQSPSPGFTTLGMPGGLETLDMAGPWACRELKFGRPFTMARFTMAAGFI